MTVVSTFQRGFSLIEAIVVIAVSGIMLGAVAMFLRWPFQTYMDTARHGQLSDLVDTAMRRIGREMHSALPNSVRVAAAGTTTCVEFLPTITGGRYRAAVDGTGAGDILDFTTADPSFDAFGNFTAAQIPAGSQVVVYNLGPSSPGADAYAGQTTRTVLSVAPEVAVANETKITITPGANPFPFASPSNRFQVIGSTSVSYVFDCPGALNAQGNGAGSITRVVNVPITAVQACPIPLGTGNATVLARNVESCGITYTSVASATQREGLVAMQLKLTQGNQGNDSVTLYHEVHVNNAP